MIFFAIFVSLLVGSSLLAWWKGGAPERIVSSMFLIAWLASVALYATEARRYESVDWIGPGLNIALFLGLYAVARRANRTWPILAASLQILIVLAQVGRILRPEWLWQVSMLVTVSWPYLQLCVVIVGTIFHWRREVISGPERSWVRSSTGAPKS